MEHKPSNSRPRRVGTFTLGLVLVVTGLFMAVSLFIPALDMTWALKSSPLILISLGTETLLATRRADIIRYDWVGILLCILLVSCSLVLYGAVWWCIYGAALSPLL